MQGSRPVESELEGLFDMSVDALCIAGFDGQLKLVNPAFARLLGYTPEELLARPFINNVHPDDVESIAAVIAELAAGNDVDGFECRQMCADGSVRWFEWKAHARPEEGIVCGVGRDVTARRVANAQLSALRHVATLVAEGVPPQDLFAVAAEEVARVIGVPVVSIARYEADGTATGCAGYSADGPGFPVGERWSLEGTSVLRLVRTSSEAARIDDYSELEGEIPEIHRRSGIRSTVGSPIVAAGHLWGAVTVSATDPELLPEGTEVRLADFTELLSTAIANAESREALARLADEQAALRRVATLVAQGVRPAEILSAVSDEVEDLFDSGAAVLRFEHDGPAIVFVGVSKSVDVPIGTRWDFHDGMASAEVYRTGRSGRVDEMDWLSTSGPVAVAGRRMGVVSTVASPIVVEGRLWGAMTLSSVDDQLPLDTGERLEKFTELVATAIANAESREALARLADEQAALRRAATLVVQGARPGDIFSAVSDEVGRLFGSDTAAVARFEHDPPAIVVVGVGKNITGIPIGTRFEHDDVLATAQVIRTGRSARVDATDWASASERIHDSVRRLALTATVASPIVVAGRLWGALTVSSTDEPLPLDTGERLERFAELVATAIANAESREALARLADEQAALRRAATLVAQGVGRADIFSALSEEISRLFGSDLASVIRFEHDPPAIVVAGTGPSVREIPVGSRLELDGEEGLATTQVYRTGRSARSAVAGGPIHGVGRLLGHTWMVASPIYVEDRLWGAITVSTKESFPSDTEDRLERFTQLVATAIANAENKAELAASRRRIVAASDETRRRIERDLHDGTQQRLVSLGLAVRAAEAEVPTEGITLRSDLSRIATGLDDAVTELQEISRGIHPPILSHGGLGPALRMLSRRSATPVALEVATDARLPEPIEAAAYYAVSEALANATKHAKASRIDVAVARHNGKLLLSIGDDGVGGADSTRGSGLVGLTDRVEALGGSIRIRSRPGDGTHITAEIPVDLDLPTDTD